MSLTQEAIEQIVNMRSELLALNPTQIESLIQTAGVLTKPVFHPSLEGDLAHFYAPFDWINEGADIVLIGITPGQHQAAQALLTLRRALAVGRSPTESAADAKQAASFDGAM